MDWRIETEKVAVFPVPDWAWAMTSWPCGRRRGGGRVRETGKRGRKAGEEGRRRTATTGMMARCWIAEGRSNLNGKRKRTG